MGQQPSSHPTRLVLRLYIAKGTPHSRTAVENLRLLVGKIGDEDCDLELVDVMDNPAQAIQDGVLVTPTLIRLSPGPTLRIIGLLQPRDSVLRALRNF